jgi:hypothetical protein
MIRLLVLGLAIGVGPAYAKSVDAPSNMTTKTGAYRGQYIDTVDFSFAPAGPVTFSKLKLCAAQRIANSGVALNDSSGSFVGPATGTYYRNSNTSVAEGGNTFKYSDDHQQAVVVSGTVDAGASSLGLVRDFVRFDLTLAIEESRIVMEFRNVTRAQQNTGNMANDGFQPVGVWKGSRFQKVYAALENAAHEIRACVD